MNDSVKTLKIIAGLFFSFCIVQSFRSNAPAYALFTAYALGSIPTGLILTNIFMNKDIRAMGSGNIGATNVLRCGSKSLAIATLAFDALKGFLAVYISYKHTIPSQAVISLGCAAAAVLGHTFPVWLNFKGGKGIATALGVLIALSPQVAIFMAMIWIFIVLFTRISSLASICVATILPILGFLIEGNNFAVFSLCISVIIFIRHVENIQRLLQGKEPKIGQHH